MLQEIPFKPQPPLLTNCKIGMVDIAGALLRLYWSSFGVFVSFPAPFRAIPAPQLRFVCWHIPLHTT